jgi:SAM-dependent methyltransferase
MPEPAAPSPWVARFAPLVPAGGPVLDLACGDGRHARLFLARGHPVIALDRDPGQLGELARAPGLEVVSADLEDGSPWPLAGRRFAAVVVTNYLFRPLFPILLDALGARALLIYETFAQGQEAIGRPTNPEFLLAPGELLQVVAGRLQVVAYEHGRIAAPRPAIKQRLCAAADPAPLTLPA